MSDRKPGGDPGSMPGPPRRDEVMDALCEAYARDEFGMEELERRLDLATRAPSQHALLELVADLDRSRLPARLGGAGGGAPGKEDPRLSARSGSEAGDDPSKAVRVPPGAGRVDSSRVPDRQFEIAFLSGRSRKGSWVPGRSITAMACMGGVELDFREAMFGADVIEVHAVALMGGVEILVPPGVHVDTAGFALLGGFEEDSSLEAHPEPGAPLVRVRGFACMGAVEVIVRLPGESARDAKRRRKLERRKKLESGE